MSVKRNIVANYFGQGWAALMGLIFVPVYIRYLGMEAYGLIGIFAALQTWLSLLDLGVTPALSREMARFRGGARDAISIRDLLRSVELVGLAAAALISIGVWAGSRWLATEWVNASSLPAETIAHAFLLMGVVTALRMVENIYRSSLIGLQQQVELNVANSILATLRSIGAVVVLAYGSPTIGAFFEWQTAASVATLVVFATLVYRNMPASQVAPRFSIAPLKEVWRFAAGSVLVTLLGFVLSQADKLILSKTLSLEEFGFYSLAFTVAGSVRLLAQPVDHGIYPRLTESLASGDERTAIRTYHRGAQFTVVLMGTIGTFLAVFGEDVLRVWMHDPALAAHTYPILWLLVLGMMLNAFMNGPYYLQMAAGWTGLLVKVNAIMVVVFVPSVYLLAQTFGARGAAAAWLILNLAYLAIVVPMMHRKLLRTEMWVWYVNDLSLPLLAACPVLLVAKIMLPAGMNAVPLIALFSLILLAAFACSALAAQEVRRTVIAKFSRSAA